MSILNYEKSEAEIEIMTLMVVTTAGIYCGPGPVAASVLQGSPLHPHVLQMRRRGNGPRGARAQPEGAEPAAVSTSVRPQRCLSTRAWPRAGGRHGPRGSCPHGAWGLMERRDKSAHPGHSERGTQGDLLGGWGRGRRASQRRRL